MIKNFTDLDAWKEGHQLVLLIYRVTQLFPKEEIFGLISQMKRCSVSITSNIAEGFGRQTYKEKIQFYVIARGSITELQNQLMIAKDVGFIKNSNDYNDIFDKTIKVHKIINGLIKKSKSLSSLIPSSKATPTS